MANLSNINGKFVVEQTTGFVGIGTTDPGFLIEAAGTNAELALNASSIYRIRSTASDEFIITKNGVGDRLTISSGGNATFAGNVLIGSTATTDAKLNIVADGETTNFVKLKSTKGTGNIYGFKTNGGNSEVLAIMDITAGNRIAALGQSEVSFATGGTTRLLINSSGNATFAGSVTAPTFLGDLNGTINTVTTATTKGNATNDTTVATTAFVQNVVGTIPAGLVFQGTWNASTNTPTLTSGSGTTGHFYIVSVAGSTNLDGITDWQVGDWAVFIEQGASDQWEKIDNSSVLSGSGTGGSFAGWSGSGTSVTLGNAPVTFSGNDSTFAGDINIGAAKKLKFNANSFITPENNTSGAEISTAGTFIVKTGSTPTLGLTLDASQNATFTGNVTITTTGSGTGVLLHTNSGITINNNLMQIWSGQSSGISFHTNSSGDGSNEKMRLDSSGNLIINDISSDLSSSGRGVVEINGTSQAILGLKVNGDVKTYLFQNGNNVELNNTASGSLTLKTAATTALTIDSSQNATFAGDVTASGDIQADQFISTNNGNGQNYRIGDDAWIGDINIANTFRIQGNQNSNNGYITFGNSSNDALGRAGTGPLTWGSSFKIADEKILGLRISSNDYAIQYRDLDFRFIGSSDGTTQRKFSFGHYTSDNFAGTWNGKTYINSYTGQTIIGNTSLPADHMLQISNPGQAYARFALTNSQTGNASGDGLKFQMENLNSIIKNQENGYLTFGTNGRETDLRIDSSGNVGIGTTSPSTLISNSSVRNAAASGLSTSLKGLNIEVPAGGNSQGYVASFANTQTASNNYNAGVLIEVGSTDTTTRLLSVESGGTNRFEIRGDGNVGIGTTSPAALLDVSSGTTTDVIRFGANSRWGFSRANSDNRYVSFMRNQNGSGTAVWTVDGDNGSVGIGVTSFSSHLSKLAIDYGNTADARGITVFTSGGLADGASTFPLGMGDAFSNNNSFFFKYKHTSDGSTINYLSVGAYGADDALVIQANKSIGIGTNDLGTEAKLAIAATNANEGGQIVLHKGTSGTLAAHIDAYFSTNDYLRILSGTNTASSSAPFVFDLTNTRLGIGITSPASPLVVVGTGVGSSGTIGIQGANAHVGFKNSSGTFRSWVGHFNAAGHGSDADLNVKTGYSSVGNIRFSADGDTTAAQMFLQGSTGNVGIANTSPSQKLHVTGSILASSDVVAFSDIKLKENIKTLDGSKVYDMHGVSFTRKDTGKNSSGVIAQEIQKIAPELVTDNDGTLSVAYGNLTGYLIEAVKELKAEIEELKKQIK